jgi:hypothetical protein
VFYFPRGAAEIQVGSAGMARWFDPRTGEWRDGPAVKKGKNVLAAPASGDWVLYIGARGERPPE